MSRGPKMSERRGEGPGAKLPQGRQKPGEIGKDQRETAGGAVLPPVDNERGEDGELRCGTANGEFFHGETNSSVWRSRPGPLHKWGIPPTRGPEGTPPSLPTDPNPPNNPAEAKEASEETRAQPRSTTSPPTAPLQWPQGTGPRES